MPPRTENPITAYFHPISSNPHLHSQVRHRPGPPAKRARQPDETETTGRQCSRKKSKTPNKDLKGKQREEDGYLLSISPKTPLGSHRSSKQAKEPNRRVIEIEDTPPSRSRPAKAVSLRHATPPSSPLPELTPSPEIEPQSLPCPPLMHRSTETVEPGPSASTESSSPRRRQVEFEFIPSSQTQILDALFDYEAPTPTCTLDIPLANVPFRSREPTAPSQNSESALSSQFNLVSSNRNSDSDDLIASSQSQAMSPIPTSPSDPEVELVPSSQTQEFFYSQRTAFYLSQEAEPESRPSIVEQSDRTVSRSRMSSPSEESEFGAVATRVSFQVPLSQASEARWDDELTSCESLPDVVKELQGMFGDTYESFPPDFPMSLR